MNKLISLLMILAAGGLLFLSGGPSEKLREERSTMSYSVQVEGLTPGVTFATIALGGFRGIIADMLWIRAERLKEEGRYYEVNDLARAVTRLEPRLPEVWGYMGWNSAYNISVGHKDFEARWRWVQNGFTILRDEGLFHNPYDANIHRELSWIFEHKIGNDFDDAHNLYKQRWYEQINELIPGGRIDPNTPADDPLWGRLQKTFKMDPETTRRLEKEYGPLDWRSPNATAMYWAYRGLEFADGFEHKRIASSMYRNMATLLKRGDTVYLPGLPFILERPNLDMLPKILKAFEQARLEHPEYDHIRTAEKNFIELGIVTYEGYNQSKQAQELYKLLAERYPEAIPQGVDDPYESLIYREQEVYLGQGPGKQDAERYALGTFFRAYLWETMGDNDRAAALIVRSRRFCARYMADKTDPTYAERVGIDAKELQRIAKEQAADYMRQMNIARERQGAVLGRDKQAVQDRRDGKLPKTELPPKPAPEPQLGPVLGPQQP